MNDTKFQDNNFIFLLVNKSVCAKITDRNKNILGTGLLEKFLIFHIIRWHRLKRDHACNHISNIASA